LRILDAQEAAHLRQSVPTAERRIAERVMVLDRTTSGGVTINDVVFHQLKKDIAPNGAAFRKYMTGQIKR
jgi:DNA-binding transcriptional regulator YdaS (Cro superfamily)